MAWLAAAAAVFFKQDASAERKAILRENLAKLPTSPSFDQSLLAQTPTRFFDPRIDAARLYADAIVKPALLAQSGTLTKNWDVSIDASSLRVPILLVHGRYDYTVPYILWDGVASTLPNATFQLFDRSGHQPFCEDTEQFVEILISWMSSQAFGAETRV